MVLLFLKNGASVYYFDLQEGDELAEYKKVASENGVQVGFHAVNVADEQSVSDGVDAVTEQAGKN